MPAERTPSSRARIDPPRLYAIADGEALGPMRPSDAVETMAAAGVRWIQLRAKTLSDAVVSAEMEEIGRRLEGRGVTLWIDDRADLAALHGWPGVHLGQHDLPPSAARRLVGEDAWIGLSTHDLDQLAAAADDPDVDVVAVGPVYPTRSKADPDPVVGLELVRRARRSTDKVLVAIGGITAERVEEVLAAGADSAVVLGDLCRGDLEANLERYRRWTGGGG